MKRAVIIGLLALVTGLGNRVEAGAPTDQLRGATDRVLHLLQDPALKGQDKAATRRHEIRSVADSIFDWQETGKRALARHWHPLSPQQRTEFSGLFADLIEQSYIGKIEAYSGETIVYAGERVDGDEATVSTKLMTKSGTQVPIDYRMAREDKRWRVYDVVIEGISLVSNYRSQFNRIITQSGYPELLKKLKAKRAELAFEGQAPLNRTRTP